VIGTALRPGGEANEEIVLGQALLYCFSLKR
jgi:hypothetical protein